MPKQNFPNYGSSNRTSSGSEGNIRVNLFRMPEPAPNQRTRIGCPRCGATIEPGGEFCVACGMQITTIGGSAWLRARPWLGPRILAEITDRLFPIAIAPVIAVPMLLIGRNGFFWTWISVAFLWHLLRDCSANRRSLGKRLFRLRVVSDSSRKHCAWWRVILRRMFSALSQSAYCIALTTYVVKLQPPNEIPWPWPFFVQSARTLLLLAFGYDVLSLAAILMSDGGRRIEDFIARTRVVCEAAYTRDRQNCGNCGALVLKRHPYCWRCGDRNAPTIKFRSVD